MAGLPSTTDGRSVQHGSVQLNRDVFGRPTTYIGMDNDSITPPRSPSPRTPRNRSPRPADDDDDDEYDDRRAERRERRDSRRVSPRGEPSQTPVAEDFRLRACEQTLREHQNELVAQRIAIQQLTEVVMTANREKEIMGNRLDSVFDLVNRRMTEYNQQFEGTSNRMAEQNQR